MRSNCQRDAARFLTHIYGTFVNLPEMKRFGHTERSFKK